MRIIFRSCTLAILSLVMVLPSFAGYLDDHYLAAFGLQGAVETDSPLGKAVLLPATSSGDPHCGTPLKHELQRDWSKLEPGTQKLLAKQVSAPVLSGSEATLVSNSGRFTIHYTTSGGDAVPNLAWVQTVAQTFDDVAASYVGLGWQLAPTPAGSRYDVYLRNLAPAGLYGQTTSSNLLGTPFAHSFSSFIEIDNNFTDGIYVNALGGPYSATESLQITAAHEYHHAIQYGYNFFFDIWYAEATSTFFEDELYDVVNQLYNYPGKWFINSRLALDTPVSTATGGGYGRWIFNRYLTEQHGAAFVRTAWERLATLNSPGSNADIPMVPVLESLLAGAPFNTTLGADFFGFSQRVYVRDWASHVGDIPLIPPYTPVSSFTTYPAASNTSLQRYSFAYYRFVPVGSLSSLVLSVNKTSGVQTTLFRKTAGIITEIPADAGGATFTVAGFGSLDPAADEVVLLAVNTTDVDSHQVSFSTSGTPATVGEPSASAPASSGGGGGGCFIATAAYGSYLHPQVKVLRDFRDNYLITNRPGRAFVELYYRLSPPLADFIARHEVLRILVRLLLSPLILAIRFPALPAALLLAAAARGVYRRRVRQRNQEPGLIQA